MGVSFCLGGRSKVVVDLVVVLRKKKKKTTKKAAPSKTKSPNRTQVTTSSPADLFRTPSCDWRQWLDWDMPTLAAAERSVEGTL